MRELTASRGRRGQSRRVRPGDDRSRYREGEADNLAISKANPARALDLHEEGIGRIAEPQDLEAASGKRSLLDLAAGEVRPGLAVDDAAVAYASQ
jgi:hypothetical protein